MFPSEFSKVPKAAVGGYWLMVGITCTAKYLECTCRLKTVGYNA